MDNIDVQKYKDELFCELKEIITSILGEDVVKVLNITMDSSFVNDLEMDSVDIIMLAGKIKDRYGAFVDFEKWLSAKSFDQIVNLQIKDIVNFITDAIHSDQSI